MQHHIWPKKFGIYSSAQTVIVDGPVSHNLQYSDKIVSLNANLTYQARPINILAEENMSYAFDERTEYERDNYYLGSIILSQSCKDVCSYDLQSPGIEKPITKNNFLSRPCIAQTQDTVKETSTIDWTNQTVNRFADGAIVAKDMTQDNYLELGKRSWSDLIEVSSNKKQKLNKSDFGKKRKLEQSSLDNNEQLVQQTKKPTTKKVVSSIQSVPAKKTINLQQEFDTMHRLRKDIIDKFPDSESQKDPTGDNLNELTKHMKNTKMLYDKYDKKKNVFNQITLIILFNPFFILSKHYWKQKKDIKYMANFVPYYDLRIPLIYIQTNK